MRTEEKIVYISYDDAVDLVERIAERAENFDYVMSEPEKIAMANLLSDIGVLVSDLINIERLADNYAINAEIVGPDEVDNYDASTLRDALFYWEDSDGTHYCIQW